MKKIVLVLLALIFVSCIPSIPVSAEDEVPDMRIRFLTPLENEDICGMYTINYEIYSHERDLVQSDIYDIISVVGKVGSTFLFVHVQVDEITDESRDFRKHSFLAEGTIVGYAAVDTSLGELGSPTTWTLELKYDFNTYPMREDSSSVRIDIDNDFGTYVHNVIRSGSGPVESFAKEVIEWKSFPQVEITAPPQKFMVNGKSILLGKVKNGVDILDEQGGIEGTPVVSVLQYDENGKKLYEKEVGPIEPCSNLNECVSGSRNPNPKISTGSIEFANTDLNVGENDYEDGLHWFYAVAIMNNGHRVGSQLVYLNISNAILDIQSLNQVLPRFYALYSLPLAIGFLIVGLILVFGPAPTPGRRIIGIVFLIISIISFIVYFQNQELLSSALQTGYDYVFMYSIIALVVSFSGILLLFVPVPGFRILGGVLIVVGIIIYFAVQYIFAINTPIDEILRGGVS